MTVNNFMAFSSNNFRPATRTSTNTKNAAVLQFRSFSEIASQAATNIAFKRDSTSVGTVASQFQSQSAVFNASKPNNEFENWCISDHYTVPHEEVLPLLKQLRQEFDNKDFTGMSDYEIYNYIEKRFAQTFGEDFLIAMRLGVDDPISNCPEFTNMHNRLAVGAFDENGNFLSSHNYREIGGAFFSILQGHFGDYVGGYNATRDVNRTRLYGEMSKDEIMDAIRGKYPANLTYRDLALMTSEMHEVGVLSFPLRGFGVYAEHNPDGSLKRMLSQTEHNKNILKMLDLQINISGLLSGYNYTVQNLRPGETLHEWNIDFKNFAIRYLGAAMGPNGLFLINEMVL